MHYVILLILLFPAKVFAVEAEIPIQASIISYDDFRTVCVPDDRPHWCYSAKNHFWEEEPVPEGEDLDDIPEDEPVVIE